MLKRRWLSGDLAPRHRDLRLVHRLAQVVQRLLLGDISATRASIFRAAPPAACQTCSRVRPMIYPSRLQSFHVGSNRCLLSRSRFVEPLFVALARLVAATRTMACAPHECEGRAHSPLPPQNRSSFILECFDPFRVSTRRTFRQRALSFDDLQLREQLVLYRRVKGVKLRIELVGEFSSTFRSEYGSSIIMASRSLF